MIKYLQEAKIDFDDKTVLISAISTGNIPTLALDLLIIANGFNRVGFIHSDHIQPSVGYLNKNIENGALGMPVQIYLKDNVIIIQLRASIRFARRKQFIKQIAQIIGNKAQLMILSSLPYNIRPDKQIGSLDKNVFYHVKQKGSQVEKILKQSKNYQSVMELIDQDEEQNQVFAKGGLAKQIFNENSFEKVCALFVFGTQMEDKSAALFLAKATRSALGVGLNKKQLSQEVHLQMMK